MTDTVQDTQPKIDDVVVTNRDIRKYFSAKEWKDMSGYEKEQTRNVLRNHLVMIKCGIKVPSPQFIAKFESETGALPQREETPEVYKRGRGRPPLNSAHRFKLQSEHGRKEAKPSVVKSAVKPSVVESAVISTYCTRSTVKH